MVTDPETLELDFEDISKTANMRCAYPLHFISNASETGLAGHPRNIIMLTCDAFGVLPPIARLTPAQAMYHFLSGFTSKDPNFGFDVPVKAEGVAELLLDPRRTWDDKEAFDRQAGKLVKMFADNFAQYVPYIDADVKAAALG
jgi:ATP-dependent phosphoenolpyruvate carboxykinase